MELRVHGEIEAIKTPTGLIPKYDDLRRLFKQVLNKVYTKEDYIKQFTIRVQENLAKIDRVSRFYQENVTDTPLELFGILYVQRQRLVEAQENMATIFRLKTLIKTEREIHLPFSFFWIKLLNSYCVLIANS